MRMTSGSRRSTIIRRPASRPAATSGNSSARNSRVSGSRVIRMVASVMMPKVPSEPRNSRMKSGPGGVVRHARRPDQRPVRQRDLDAHHEVFGLAVLGADRARPARREIAAERGALRRRRIVRQRQAAIAQRPFEHRAVDAGLRPSPTATSRRSRGCDRAASGRRRCRCGSAARRPACPSRRPTAGPGRGAGARRPGRGRLPRRCPGWTMTSGRGVATPRSSVICGSHEASTE